MLAQGFRRMSFSCVHHDSQRKLQVTTWLWLNVHLRGACCLLSTNSTLRKVIPTSLRKDSRLPLVNPLKERDKGRWIAVIAHTSEKNKDESYRNGCSCQCWPRPLMGIKGNSGIIRSFLPIFICVHVITLLHFWSSSWGWETIVLLIETREQDWWFRGFQGMCVYVSSIWLKDKLSWFRNSTPVRKGCIKFHVLCVRLG